MATRARGTVAAAPAKAGKKEVVITTKDLLKFEGVNSDGYAGGTNFQRLQCCAFVEYSGLEVIKSVEDAAALRRAASGNLRGHTDEDGDELIVSVEINGDEEDLDGHKGAILITTIPSQSNKYPFLEKAGFQRLGTFKGN